MLKKRLIGVVTVRQGLAVQSMGYQRYLPLGKPEVLIENLDRWGADEIFVQCIDRSVQNSGPDFKLLKRLGSLGLSTPLIYGGGIRGAEDAVHVVSIGADRISVDALLWDAPYELDKISYELGKQALIANMPVRVKGQMLVWKNYRSGIEINLNEESISSLYLDCASEVMLTDWTSDGKPSGFDLQIPKTFPLPNKPILLFGGLSEPVQLQKVLTQNNVVAAGIGNFLNYKEHAIQKLKENIVGISIREVDYSDCGCVQ